MTVRANWYTSDLDLSDGSDPMQEIADIVSRGEVIDLTKTQPELTAELQGLLEQENRLYKFAADDNGKRPLTCRLKWDERHRLISPDGALSCYTCPHHVADPTSARAVVCRLGREQETAVEHLRGLELADTLDAELCAAMERDIEESAELAEACLALV